VHEAVEPPRLLAVEVGVDVDVDLARDAHAQVGGVEERDRADAVLGPVLRSQERVGSDADRGDRSDAGDDDSLHGMPSPLERAPPGGGGPRYCCDAMKRTASPTVRCLGFLVADLDAELVLETHDQLDDVERVGAQVVDERRAVDHVARVGVELVRDDVADLVQDGGFVHERTSYELCCSRAGARSCASLARTMRAARSTTLRR
jgi:hypothetical protein